MQILIQLVVFLISLDQALLSLVEKPEFERYGRSELDKDTFFEQFDYESLLESEWVTSSKKSTTGSSYIGRWAIEEPTVYAGFKDDKGLVMKTPSAHYAISRQFAEPLNFTGRDLVVQYEIKFQRGILCGGSYVKLLEPGFAPKNFKDDTPFKLMFGPDVCGSTNKVHLIFRKFNPLAQEYEEKHLRTAPMARTTQLSTLYTLIIKQSQDFEIRVNGEVIKAGNLLSNKTIFEPPFSPPEYIDDVNDTKPSDWVDDPTMEDPEYRKPENYDIEHGSLWIPDPNAQKPAEWDENEPQTIPDELARKPELWNDDEDGEWLPPLVPNPKCVKGCGKWSAPFIENPNYSGPWKPKYILNPMYKGLWRPRQVKNPLYYNDTTPGAIDSIGGIGFELWTVESDVLFDNIYLGSSVGEAEKVGNLTFLPKLDAESQEFYTSSESSTLGESNLYDSIDSMIDEGSSLSFSSILAGIKLVWSMQVEDLSSYYVQFLDDPLITITTEPLKFVVYCCAGVALFTFAFGLTCAIALMMLSKSSSNEAVAISSDVSSDTSDKTEVAEASGRSERVSNVKNRRTSGRR